MTVLLTSHQVPDSTAAVRLIASWEAPSVFVPAERFGMSCIARTTVILGLLLPLFCLPLTSTATDTRPNLVVILADDLGAADLQCCGASDMRTPALNQLFAAGMKFSNGYANSPVCSPTRAALLSGRYPETTGVPGVIRTDAADSWGYLSSTVELLPVAARKAGYHTAIIGKWHLDRKSTRLNSSHT